LVDEPALTRMVAAMNPGEMSVMMVVVSVRLKAHVGVVSDVSSGS